MLISSTPLPLPLFSPFLVSITRLYIVVKMAKTNDQFDKSFLDVDIKELVKQLTIEEKVSLLAGAGWWETVPVPRKNVPR